MSLWRADAQLLSRSIGTLPLGCQQSGRIYVGFTQTGGEVRRGGDRTSVRLAVPGWPDALLLHGVRLDRQTGEIALGSRPDPEGHVAGRVAEFEVVHDEGGLRRSVDVEPGGGALHGDADPGPDAGLQIHVTLVLLRRLLARAGEVEVGERAVLRRVIAAYLVVGASVGRPQVDVLEPA